MCVSWAASGSCVIGSLAVLVVWLRPPVAVTIVLLDWPATGSSSETLLTWHLVPDSIIAVLVWFGGKYSCNVAANSCMSLTLAAFCSAWHIHGGFLDILPGGLGGSGVLVGVKVT